jgi:DNA polymerase III epsilon subunit-like protein
MDAQTETRPEALVSVDIEASGPSPSTGSLLSVGACLISNPETNFYVELKPSVDLPWEVEAERIHGLERDRLSREGLEPAAAMSRLEDWLAEACAGAQPIFVGFNSPYDWMFVADYFWRHIGRNPFGVSALDLKSYYMGREAVTTWNQTRRMHIDARYGLDPDHTHHALEDALGQARLARFLLDRDRPEEPSTKV